MITLCGFAVSNYYNKVKMVLLEKGIPFTEEWVMTKSKDEAVLSCSPLGKVPYIRTERGALCESQVIVEYLEALSPQTPLTPSDPWAAAKVRELVTFIELHLELVARELYAQAFFGGTVDEATRERVRKQLVKNIAGFKRLAKFAPYVAGAEFTQADCAAHASLSGIGMATKLVYGEDLLEAGGVDWKAYGKLIGARPSAQRVAADRKTASERMAAAAKS
jgi:glutathione S-transferase